MLKDILEIIFALPNEDQMKNMSATEREELLHKFDKDDSEKE